ncbi:MAG: methylated-DNA--[protein]-cysteine S-methyltransferase [Actinobacteria bacterium]|nr:methylated-DNA--[protein]-cysteine S-methyltransferase [Actinomycetota bacterium]
MDKSLPASPAQPGRSLDRGAAGEPPGETAWRVFYDTRFGRGILAWRGGILMGHELPAPASKKSATARSGGREESFGKALASSKPWQRRLAAPVVASLESYFAGVRTDFEALSLSLDFDSLTDFELDVIQALAGVGYGNVLSYGELARRSGHPRAWRAVGSVMARNRYPLILPCHRVVRSSGKLGNFSSGTEWKQRLLDLEGVHLARLETG